MTRTGRLVTAALLLAALVATPTVAIARAPVAAAASRVSMHYAVARPICTGARPGQVHCFAMRRVAVTPGTPGATAYSIPPGVPLGPAGGYTPADIQTAYGLPPVRSGTPVIAVVAAFNDPTARSDLDAFDTTYRLPAETHRSFQKRNQSGHASPLPPREPGWAGEQTVDLQAIRGLCHRCRIRLVEASTQDPADLAATENAAAKLHPAVISNSFGYPETAVPAGLATAFDHPRIVIVASDGDNGMDDWDLSNSGSFAAPSAPEWPASLPTVVAVGGTSLYLNAGGSYLAERAWDNDGPDNNSGGAAEQSMGATGGGCSTRDAAPGWQRGLRRWRFTGCGSQRLAADVAADADPFTGYDVYQSYGALSPGWETAGGTSLSAPFIAAMFALAGGAHGVRYPAVDVYRRLERRPNALHDVFVGGNGYCGGDSAQHCLTKAGGNPNQLSGAFVDCSFSARGTRIHTRSTACNAAPGYDGPTGVGSPAGLDAVTPLPLRVRVEVHRDGSAYRFRARVTDPTRGAGHLLTAVWHWHDGTPPGTGRTPRHRFRGRGGHRVRVRVTDRFGEHGTATFTVSG